MALREIRQSATANGDYQACQRRYMLSHVCQLKSTRDKDSLRVGEVWHKCHELIEMKSGAVCPKCQKREEIRADCYICGGFGVVPSVQMDAVVRYLNHKYVQVPENKTPEEWQTERIRLMYSLSGHRWLYGADDRFETIGSEEKFVIPVIDPTTGRKVPKVVFVCKVDRLVREKATGLVYVWERKSTSKDLGDSTYWNNLTHGDQVSGYIYGGRYAQASGQLKHLGINPSDPPIAGAILDVWHKPDIKPKDLSQGATAEFVETGMYCGAQFNVVSPPDAPAMVSSPTNGTEISQTIEGKKANAMRETPGMYGARLLADIAERPNHYFAQRAASMTDQELVAFQFRLFNIAKQIRFVEKGNRWVANRSVCEQPFYCEYRDLCNSIGFDAVPGVGGVAIPSGYEPKFK